MFPLTIIKVLLKVNDEIKLLTYLLTYLLTNQVSSSPLGKEGVHPSTFFVGTPAHSGLASRKIKNIRVTPF